MPERNPLNSTRISWFQSALKERVQAIHVSQVASESDFPEAQVQAFIAPANLADVLDQLRRATDIHGLDFFEDLFAVNTDSGILLTARLSGTRAPECVLLLRVPVELAGPTVRAAIPAFSRCFPAAVGQELEISELFGVEFLGGDAHSAQFSIGDFDAARGFPLRDGKRSDAPEGAR